MLEQRIERAVAALRSADSLLVTAGAGMGIDSGLPDFRGEGGFWGVYPALGRARISFMQIANPAAFERTPDIAWGFYGHRLRLYRETVPHEGFGLLKRVSAAMPKGAYVFTSNVDGQFQKAGFDANRIVEVHGSIHHLQCQHGCLGDIWEAGKFDPLVDDEACQLQSDPPRCPHCGEIARPNILMFGDWYWLNHRSAMQRVALDQWLKQCRRPVVVEVGAGTDIPTVRNFGDLTRSTVIRINPNEPGVEDERTIPLPLGGLDGIRRLVEAFRPEI